MTIILCFPQDLLSPLLTNSKQLLMGIDICSYALFYTSKTV
jgi:hypothetical protein